MVNEPDPRVRRLIDALRPKAKSLLVTIYGDAIAHRGGNAWLGSVIARSYSGSKSALDWARAAGALRFLKKWFPASRSGRTMGLGAGGGALMAKCSAAPAAPPAAPKPS